MKLTSRCCPRLKRQRDRPALHLKIEKTVRTNGATSIALSAGVTRAQARDELARLGLDIKQNTFNVLLMRVRKERHEETHAPSAENGPSAPVAQGQARLDNQKLEKPVLQKEEKVKRGDADTLPADWLTAELTPTQARALSPEQKQQRRKARDKLFHPTPYDKLHVD